MVSLPNFRFLFLLAAALSLLIGACKSVPTGGGEVRFRVNLGTEPPSLDWSLATDHVSFNVIANLIISLNVAYDAREPRSFLRRRAIALAFVVIGGLVIACLASALYVGLVFARTVFLTEDFDPLVDTTALDVLTMFLNTGTFLIIAIVAGGLADRFRETTRQLETQRRDLRDLQAFKDVIFQSVSTGLIALDEDYRVPAFNRAAETITGTTVFGSFSHWCARNPRPTSRRKLLSGPLCLSSTLK